MSTGRGAPRAPARTGAGRPQQASELWTLGDLVIELRARACYSFTGPSSDGPDAAASRACCWRVRSV